MKYVTLVLLLLVFNSSLSWADCDDFIKEPSDAQVASAAATYLKGLSRAVLTQLEVDLQRRERGEISARELLAAAYMAHNPAAKFTLQGWMPLHAILQNVPRSTEHWDSLPVHGRLNLFVNVGAIEGPNSQGLARRLAHKTGHAVKSYPFWPVTEMDFKKGLGYMSADSVRLNVVSENGEAEIIEGMVYDNAMKSWLPLLYEFQPESGKFERVFASRNGIHSIAKCMVCHGTGEGFNPIPFKSKGHYTPSAGWFFSERPESYSSKFLTEDWAVSDHDSLIESIRRK